MCVKGPRNCAGRKSLYQLRVAEENGIVYVSDVPQEMLDFRKHFPTVGVPLAEMDGRVNGGKVDQTKNTE